MVIKNEGGVTNRAPSPMASRPNPNPNPNSRNHQEREGVGIVPARKSFSGYPLGKPSLIPSQPRSFVPSTPANSPAEYMRRNSFSKDHHEQKENERDPNSKPTIARTRSPSVTKGTKKFMSPTISAASKINASPRKKVLGERNEAIRASASLTDGKFHFFSTSSLDFADEDESKPPCSTTTTDFDKKGNEVSGTIETENNVAGFTSEPDMVVLSPEIPPNAAKSSESLPLSEMPKTVDDSNVSSSPSIIAPLDADPSLPPYDPKNNYLSPRPQFLHYKPNSRIESYINQGINLEDEFSSESFSETEHSEEIQPDDSPKEQECSSSSSSPSVTLSSSVDEKSQSSELNPLETKEVQETIEAQSEHTPRFFMKWKTVTFLLVLLIGFISFSVTSSPNLRNALYQDKTMSKIYNDPRGVGDLAKANLNDLLQNAKLWSVHSVSHLTQLIHNLGEAHQFRPVQFRNITGCQEGDEDYMVEDFAVGPYFESSKDMLETAVDDDESAKSSTEMQSSAAPEDHEPAVEESELRLEVSEPVKVEEYFVSCLIEHESHYTADLSSDPLNEAEYLGEPALVDEPENQEADHTQEGTDVSSVVLDEFLNDSVAQALIYEPENQEADDHTQEEDDISSGVEDESQIVVKTQGPEAHPQVLSASEPSAEDEQDSIIDTESDNIGAVKSDLDRLAPENTAEISQLPQVTGRRLASSTIVVISLVTSLMAALAFINKRPKKDGSVISAPMVADQLVAKEKSLLSESLHSSWTGPVEVDMDGQSCPSEMSSFQNTSSYSKKVPRGLDEAQSIEKRPKKNYKRESLASSSEHTMGSSYGSFTTYSIIPSKHGDDEVVTPVRRSSRIRKQVISP